MVRYAAAYGMDFTVRGWPVVALARSDDARMLYDLRLFADHRHVHEFLGEIADDRDSKEVMHGLARTMMSLRCALPSDMGEEGVCRIGGRAADTLTQFLIDLQNYHVSVGGADLLGFWEPVGSRQGDGIILWFHPNDGYRCIIAHSQEQAAAVVRKLSWLGAQRSRQLISHINGWNASPRSGQSAQEIKGVCAEVLCYASLAAKYKSAVEQQRGAFLN